MGQDSISALLALLPDDLQQPSLIFWEGFSKWN